MYLHTDDDNTAKKEKENIIINSSVSNDNLVIEAKISRKKQSTVTENVEFKENEIKEELDSNTYNSIDLANAADEQKEFTDSKCDKGMRLLSLLQQNDESQERKQSEKAQDSSQLSRKSKDYVFNIDWYAESSDDEISEIDVILSDESQKNEYESSIVEEVDNTSNNSHVMYSMNQFNNQFDDLYFRLSFQFVYMYVGALLCMRNEDRIFVCNARPPMSF